VFLLVPAHPVVPDKGHKTVVVVVILVGHDIKELLSR